MGKLYDTKLKKIPQWAKLIVVFVITAVTGLVAFGNFDGTDALFGGGGLIVKLTSAEKFSWGIVFALFLIRFLPLLLLQARGLREACLFLCFR